MKNKRRIFLILGLAAVSLLLSGCISSVLAHKIVEAPNRQGKTTKFNDEKSLAACEMFYAHSWRTVVGPPNAELSVAVINPRNYRLVYDIKETVRPDGCVAFAAKINWKLPESKAELEIGALPPKATLVLLHGMMMNKESMLPWALFFAEKGYRVVIVDLRGHGRSTGKWVGFGAWEADDLVKVTDELQRRGLLTGKLGVFGGSYGAAMGIHWAARDWRVAAVVALAPFSDPRTAIPEFARGFDPKLAGKLSNATFAAAEAKAAALAGFAWSDVNVLDVIKRVHVPVLFFHGKYDTWVLPAQSEALALVAPVGSRREVTPNDDHLNLMLRLDLLGPQVLAWFDERLQDGGSTQRRMR